MTQAASGRKHWGHPPPAVSSAGDIFYGPWYPIVVALIALVTGILFLPETARRLLTD